MTGDGYAVQDATGRALAPELEHDYYTALRYARHTQHEVGLRYWKRSTRVLDVGCQLGALGQVLADTCHDYTGLDTDSSVLASAQASLPDAHFFQEDVESPSVTRNGTYDAEGSSASAAPGFHLCRSAADDAPWCSAPGAVLRRPHSPAGCHLHQHRLPRSTSVEGLHSTAGTYFGRCCAGSRVPRSQQHTHHEEASTLPEVCARPLAHTDRRLGGGHLEEQRAAHGKHGGKHGGATDQQRPVRRHPPPPRRMEGRSTHDVVWHGCRIVRTGSRATDSHSIPHCI